MFSAIGRVTDGLLTRLVPETMAAAADCRYYEMCNGSFCSTYSRHRRYLVCCPQYGGGEKCEEYRRSTCTCYVGPR